MEYASAFPGKPQETMRAKREKTVGAQRIGGGAKHAPARGAGAGAIAQPRKAWFFAAASAKNAPS
jgi:hypothetical protein